MNDNDIINGLKCCIMEKCAKCTLKAMNCSPKVHIAFAIELINRQKADIERLKKVNGIISRNADTAFQNGLNEAQELYSEQIKNEVKAEAIKEFAERLKNELSFGKYIQSDQIDNLVKEMVGDGK